MVGYYFLSTIIKKTLLFSVVEYAFMQKKFDYTKLRQRISEKYGTPEKFAQAVGFSPVTLAARLNNAVDFTQSEIDKTCAFLEIQDGEIADIFFTKQ